MDNAKRVELLQAQIEEANSGAPEDFEGWRHRTGAALRLALTNDHPLADQFKAVRYSPSIRFSGQTASDRLAVQTSGVKKAIAVLEGAIYEIQAQEPTGPSPNMDGLHPWVLGVIIGLWEGGNHRTAVDEATRSIEIKLRAKIGGDLGGTDLVTQAFNTAPPTENQPRLRFPEYEEETRAWTNAHQGAMHFGQGCMLRIRNLIEHHDDEITPQYALECLFALSLLARWIDEAEVEIAD